MKHPKKREPLRYSEDFKEAVVSVFLSSERIHRMLDENAFTLGYSFSEGSISSISPALVISLLEAGRVETLLRVAKEAEAKRQLYEMWKKEVYE
jgi:hypothetical protein